MSQRWRLSIACRAAGLLLCALAAFGCRMGCLVAEAAESQARGAVVEQPVWLGSRAGISDEVLSPWEPVQVAGRQVVVWGRAYQFGDLPFPRSVVSRQSELLAAPVRLAGSVDGKPLVWTAAGFRVEEASAHVVRLSVAARSESLRCEGRVAVEYDGMVRCDLGLVPDGKPARLSQLALEIPLRAEHARYLHFWPGRWGSCFNSGALPNEGYRGEFKPFVWLGDEWRGLAWFSESDRNFFNPRTDRVIEIQRENDTVLLRVNLVGQSHPLDRALEYTFGFQATPVKPARPDVWDLRICHMGRYGMPESQLDRLAQLGIRTMCFHEHWTDIQAYPKTTHGEELKKLVRACHDRNIQLLLYIGYEMSTIAPEWDAYHEQCLVYPRRGGYKRKYQPEPDQTAYVVCYRSVWQDFIAYHLEKLIEQYGIDGVYLDGTSEPWGCRNQKHGCGYQRPDGTIGPTYPIFDTRRMMKRIYTIVKKQKPQGQVNVHQSTCMTIPTLAFATSYWDGEQLQSVPRPGFAQEILPLDAFRTEFMGHNWGVPAELLHYASGPFKRFEAVAMALLHDVLVRPGTMADVEVCAKMWHAMDAFGRRQATWLPYWENGRYVRAEPAEVKVSLYNRPGRGLVAVVANTGRQECQAQVAFNLRALGQPPQLAARDLLADRPLPVSNGRLTLKLGSLDAKMLRLEPK